MKDEKTTANAVASANIDFSRVCGHHARRISLAIKTGHFSVATNSGSFASRAGGKQKQAKFHCE
jgi:hypothetical protein